MVGEVSKMRWTAALLLIVCCPFAKADPIQRHLLEACSTVNEIAQDADLTIFLTAAKMANISAPFGNPEWAYTVLAPVNEAFEDAAANLNITLPELVSSPDLPSILNNHLLAYPLTVEELIVAGTVHTQYNFEPLTVAAEAIDAEQLVEISSPINTANVIKDDIEACKSFVHIIDAVLLPEL